MYSPILDEDIPNSGKTGFVFHVLECACIINLLSTVVCVVVLHYIRLARLNHIQASFATYYFHILVIMNVSTDIHFNRLQTYCKNNAPMSKWTFLLLLNFCIEVYKNYVLAKMNKLTAYFKLSLNVLTPC